MGVLPSGTVSLLFSDIEGSTALLSRLGADYATALDGQRQVLRKAWAAHSGAELGTEGDGFFVAFPTAPDAISAAVQAQRELAGFAWPAGEQVRVRMGVHTGSPTLHDGGYVGMDVHRAARIAGTAHGGQVVISAATAGLVNGSLPDGVGLHDLGSHQLKDIAAAEHLFQLTIAGLATEFPALKSLGMASSLPRPATPLVGRDGELAELTALLSSPGVHLVTLTGPGGSGKTRLAIGLAERLVAQFPDGLYFIALAAVTNADVMWTTIAESLDVPPEGRIPPGFFEHVAHRSALFVLDNLEQFPAADTVVAELLEQAPQVVIVATSRRVLNVTGELQHEVPPLELPAEVGLEDAERSGAVQLFVQHAQAVRSTFALTADNAADIVQICRRLDGLPLAIELVAARSKLLSPPALLARLDNALDVSAAGGRRPSRQQSLRETIAWSYRLLTPHQQAFFRRLGVFAGGADLNSVAALTRDLAEQTDVLDTVGKLVDASLVSVTEGLDQEPRVTLLQTIRAFALDELSDSDELDAARTSHALLLLESARDAEKLSNGPQQMTARRRLEVEHDNLREALSWTLDVGAAADRVERHLLGLQICDAIGWFWIRNGYLTEARRWLETSIELGRVAASPHLAATLHLLAFIAHKQGENEEAKQLAAASVALSRAAGDSPNLVKGLSSLGVALLERREFDDARVVLVEAATLADQQDDDFRVMLAKGDLSIVAAAEGDLALAMTLLDEALEIAGSLGDQFWLAMGVHELARFVRQSGDLDSAMKLFRKGASDILAVQNSALTMSFAEHYAATLVHTDHVHTAIRLLASAEAMRERTGIPPDMPALEARTSAIATSEQALSSAEWHQLYQSGRDEPLEELLLSAQD